MGQLEDLQVFVTIVECSSISRAAEELHLAKSAVSRRLSSLEERFDVRLVDRHRGAWELTAAGRELYQRALQLVQEGEELAADFKQLSHTLAGPLSVSVAGEFGAAFLRPVLLDFKARHPEIQLTVDFDDRQVDLDHENYDLAIRITEELDADLIAQRLGTARHGLYASPAYVDEVGLPRTLDDLGSLRLLHYGTRKRAEWAFQSDAGKQTLVFTPTLNSNSGQFLYHATLDGLGVSRLPEFIASQASADGRLVRLLPELRVTDWTINLVHRANRRVNRRMRAFAEAMQVACKVL